MTWDPTQRLLTITEAAATIDRPESTIRRWISETRLRPVATQGRRRLYLEADVLRVDAQTRQATRGAPTEHSSGTLSP